MADDTIDAEVDEQVALPEVPDPDAPEETPAEAAGLAPLDDVSVNVLDLPGKEKAEINIQDIPLDDISEIDNIRPEYYGIEELAENLHMNTQLEPVLLRPAPADAQHDKPWEMVFGYRRKRAAERLGWATIRADIREVETDQDILGAMISENLQRENLSPMAEANAIRQMMDIGGLSQAAVARILGKHPSHISHRLSLFRLPDSVKTAVDEGRLSVSHAEKIAELDDAEQQEKFAVKAMRSEAPVKKLASWINEVKNPEPQGLADLAPLEVVELEDVQDLPRIHPRQDISDMEIERLSVYQMLRNGNDIEVQEWLLEEHNILPDQLWHYVMGLEDHDIVALRRVLALRYVATATRFPSLEPELIDAFDSEPEFYDLGDEQISLERLTAPRPELMPAQIAPLPTFQDPFGEDSIHLDDLTGNNDEDEEASVADEVPA